MILRDMPAIDAAINEESWTWLQDYVPIMAQAVADEVKRNATPEQIRRHVMTQTQGQRPALAARCGQAAAYLEAEKGSIL